MAVGKRVGKRGRGGRRARAGVGLGIGGANPAVASLQACAAELTARRAELDTQLQAIEQALRVMGAAVARGPAGRPAGRRGGGMRAGSLKDHIQRVLGGGGVMSVKDITAGVLSSGYVSKNRTLAKSVGIALTEMGSVRKVARGKFRLK